MTEFNNPCSSILHVRRHRRRVDERSRIEIGSISQSADGSRLWGKWHRAMRRWERGVVAFWRWGGVAASSLPCLAWQCFWAVCRVSVVTVTSPQGQLGGSLTSDADTGGDNCLGNNANALHIVLSSASATSSPLHQTGFVSRARKRSNNANQFVWVRTC